MRLRGAGLKTSPGHLRPTGHRLPPSFLRVGSEFSLPCARSGHKDVQVTKLYVGAMGISNRPFLKPYEEPSSPQFDQLASLVCEQVRAAPPAARSLEASLSSPLCLSAEDYVREELCAGQVLLGLHGSDLQVAPASPDPAQSASSE